MKLFLSLENMKRAIKAPGEAYQLNATGGGHWDKYFWISFAGF